MLCGVSRALPASPPLAGSPPIEASSGDVVRHRLSRAGDRQLNFALHVMAVTQARQHPSGRAYYLRKRAQGHSDKEALRCLKWESAWGTTFRQIGQYLRQAYPQATHALVRWVTTTTEEQFDAWKLAFGAENSAQGKPPGSGVPCAS